MIKSAKYLTDPIVTYKINISIKFIGFSVQTGKNGVGEGRNSYWTHVVIMIIIIVRYGKDA